MAEQKGKIIDHFYGGIIRDEKSRIDGAALNMEELDIFENANYVRAAQIFSADTMPAGTAVYSYTGDNSDVVYGYGANTGGSNQVRLVQLTSGGNDNPGSFSTLATSSDATNLAFSQSPIAFHQTTEASNSRSLYYLKKVSTSIYLVRYNLGASAEQRWDGSTWTASGSLDANTQLTGHNATNDRYFMRVEFGELYIGNGNKIAKVDSEGVFVEDAFTLPVGWEAVDIAFVADIGLILSRNINVNANYSKAYWWDLTSSVQFDDSIMIPHGGPQWIVNFKERIYAMCAKNGVARFYTSQAYQGTPLIEIPGMELKNVATETSTQEVSSQKMMAIKDNILYFGVYKTDKTGVYALGQLDEGKPVALVLAKRFHTTSYASHVPYSVYTQGPNFFATFSDNGTASHARCESNNSPTRSSNAVYESFVLDEGDPTKNKDIISAFVTTKPLPASTDVDLYVSTNYGSYTEVLREDDTSFNTENSTLGVFKPRSSKGKGHQIKFQLTSSGTDSPIVTGVAYIVRVDDGPAYE